MSVLAAAAPLPALVPAQAQTTLAADADTSTELESIVVTSRKRTENIQSVPISIQAFTGRALDVLGVKSSSDIAQFTGNVEIALPAGVGNQPLLLSRCQSPSMLPREVFRRRSDLWACRSASL